MSKITYDVDYSNCDVNTCINTYRGVCWHYAKIASVLLENAGVYNEIMVGTAYDNYHMWLRCKVDNNWIYVDPIGYKTLGSTYVNIDYQDYLKKYVVQFRSSIKK